ncbi:hypothetical protein SBF1_7980003 [Candidatus Desulfosporosinus infrequens]|uniref:Uncharacterized protein n=1 Tax=Candidatus Desulfosporosinus infrequens TaxID=2043169 RepID=A0A2U3LS43_9FIRM|nr:hypothetical protein SBF1_7980003 [Candidatus Desulfosporosinus infrequens]
MAQKSASTYKWFSGYCPHLDGENMIRTEYAEINICGSISLGNKLLGFNCSATDECKLDRECPLFKIAMKDKP